MPLILLMGLYLCVCESSFVNAVENACIVEEIRLSLLCKLVTTQEKVRDVWGKQSLLKTGERRKYPPGRGGRVKRSSRDHKLPLRRKDMYRTQKKPHTDENHARGCVPNYVLRQAKASKLVTTQEKARDVWGKTIFIENR